MGSHSFIGNKTFRVLVVDDDLTCLSIVAAILKKWKREVQSSSCYSHALCTLRVDGNAFDLAIVDVHMPEMTGFELQQVINKEFKLPTIFMSADEKEGACLNGIDDGTEFFVPKPVCSDALRNLWQYAATDKEKAVQSMLKNTTFALRKKILGLDESSSDGIGTGTSGSKARELSKRLASLTWGTYSILGEKEKDDNVDSTMTGARKQKLVWTPALHDKFLEAVRRLGLDRAVPKKILEVMEVPGLTRDNVASHLQKYRIFLKRVADASSRIDQLSPESSFLESSFLDRSTVGSRVSPKKPLSMLSNLRSQQQKWPFYGGMHDFNPSILDTSSFSFPVLETSMFSSAPASGLAQSHSFLNQADFMQVSQLFGVATPKSVTLSAPIWRSDDAKFGDGNSAYMNTGTSSDSCDSLQNLNHLDSDNIGCIIADEPASKSFEIDSSSCSSNSNKGLSTSLNEADIGPDSALEDALGEDDIMLDPSEITSLLDTFFPDEQPHICHHGNQGNASMNQPNFLVSPNQGANGKEVSNAGAMFDSNVIEDHVVVGKQFDNQAVNGKEFLNFGSSFDSNAFQDYVVSDEQFSKQEQQHSAKEAMASNFSGNDNQRPVPCFPGLNPPCNMYDDDEFLEYMLQPVPDERDTTLQGLF